MGLSNTSVAKFFDKNQITYDCYVDGMDDIDIKKYQLIIKSPGIKPDTKLLKLAKTLNIKVITDLELYYLLNKNTPIIGITGSNGKTTVTTLINQILNVKYHYRVGGNIGIPLFDLIDNNALGTIIECSSFMLENTYKFKPHIWIILNIECHHLDFHQTFENYFNSKTKCINKMKENDIVIYNYDDEKIKECVSLSKCKKISFSKNNYDADAYISDNKLFYHNVEYFNLDKAKCKNAIIHLDFLVALIVGKIYNIEQKFINNIFINFNTIKYRCEIIYQTSKLIIINDSKSTSPRATLTAFEFINTQFPKYQTLWIAGGKKTMDNYELLNSNKITNVLTYLYGENKDDLCNILDSNKFNTQLFPNLEEIIKKLNFDDLSPKVILFSPAAPSLDMFSSFEERGKMFEQLINEYLKK